MADQLSRRGRVVAAAVLTAVVVALFVLPQGGMPDVDAPGASPLSAHQLAHVFALAGLMIGWAWALPHLRLRWLCLGGIVLGSLAEAAQGLPFVQRTPRLVDLALNLLGVVIGALLVAAWRFRRGRKLGA